MQENAFIASVYFLDGANFPSWLEYDSDNEVWQAFIEGTSPMGLEEITTMQGTFEFPGKQSGSYIDRNMNKVVTKQKHTGKLTICVDAQIYNNLVKRQSSPCNIVILSRDIGQGDYVHQVRPHFEPTTKAGEMQIADMTFEFDQGANVLPQYQRRRLFEIVAPRVGAPTG